MKAATLKPRSVSGVRVLNVDGLMLTVRKTGGTPAESRAAAARAIAMIRAPKTGPNVLDALREFRDNPRGE